MTRREQIKVAAGNHRDLFDSIGSYRERRFYTAGAEWADAIPSDEVRAIASALLASDISSNIRVNDATMDYARRILGKEKE